MSEEQFMTYNGLKQEALDKLGQLDGTPTFIILKLFTNLQKIISNNYPGLSEISNPRIEVLLSLIQKIDSNAKIIIMAKYQYDIEKIQLALEGVYPADCIKISYGRISVKQRDKNINDFQQYGKFLVGTGYTAGLGHSLIESHHTIFYNNSFRYSHRLQTESRTYRYGQTKDVYYYDIICEDSIDCYISEALKRKENIVKKFIKELRSLKSDGRLKDYKGF